MTQDQIQMRSKTGEAKKLSREKLSYILSNLFLHNRIQSLEMRMYFN